MAVAPARQVAFKALKESFKYVTSMIIRGVISTNNQLTIWIERDTEFTCRSIRDIREVYSEHVNDCKHGTTFQRRGKGLYMANSNFPYTYIRACAWWRPEQSISGNIETYNKLACFFRYSGNYPPSMTSVSLKRLLLLRKNSSSGHVSMTHPLSSPTLSDISRAI